jgi:transposase
VDECGVDEYLYREYAYAPRGQKVVAEISGKKFKRTNFAAGICLGKWVAPIEYSGTTDSRFFEWWFEICLLQAIKPGSVIVLDNATFHRKSVLPGLAQQKYCSVLFLPAYSPDLNPIEKKWAWLKKKLRKILLDFDSFELAAEDCFQVV